MVGHEARKVLLMAYTQQDAANAIRLMGKLTNEKADVILLGLDYGSWAEYRKQKTDFKTPEDYVDRSKSQKIDNEAARLARGWYKSIEDKMTYHGISLGQMGEYDFVHLFLDAARAVEIANRLLHQEKPDQIFMPIRIPVFRANNVRYEAMHSVMSQFAKSAGIQVMTLGSANVVDLGPTRRKLKLLAGDLVSAVYASLKHAARSPSRSTIAFIGVSEEVFSPIADKLQQDGYLARRTELYEVVLHHLYQSQVRGADELWRILSQTDQLIDLAYEGVQLAKVLAGRFSQFLFEKSVQLVSCIQGVESFIRAQKVLAVVVMEDITPLYRVIIKVCRENGIPTLVIQHGIYGADIGGFHVMPVEADKQAVWGNAYREWAIRRGKLPETEVVTGNPRYDRIIRGDVSAEENRSAVCRRLGLNSQMGLIMIASEWYQPISFSYTPEQNEAFIRGALTAVKEFPEKQVVVKLHPSFWREYEEITRSIVEDLQSDNVVITKDYLWELLRMCDLVVTEGSGVGLEALLFDKPVVTLGPGGQAYLDPYANVDAVIRVSRIDDLRSSIKDALYSTEIREKLAEARSKALYDNLYLQDGNASGRVADLIRQMISTSIN